MVRLWLGLKKRIREKVCVVKRFARAVFLGLDSGDDGSYSFHTLNDLQTSPVCLQQASFVVN